MNEDSARTLVQCIDEENSRDKIDGDVKEGEWREIANS